ncbi:MAG: 6-hydroxymethylpterin diphosphokinase MptE-like protein, partial [Methylococcales bacterium]
MKTAAQTVFLDSHNLGALTTNAFNDTYFYNLNRNSFDKIGAQALFEAKFKDKLQHVHTLTVIIGTDSGLLPKYLKQKGLANGARFIFIEPASILIQLQQQQLLPDTDAAIAYINPDEWEQTIREFKIQDYFYINAVQSFNAFCAEDDYNNVYAELSWHITEVLAQYHWNYSMSLGNETFTTRQLFNVADNLLPAKLLNKAFAGKTVAVLAGGPSLDEVLPWVQSHREQLVVFAVSRISRQLKNINLE